MVEQNIIEGKKVAKMNKIKILLKDKCISFSDLSELKSNYTITFNSKDSNIDIIIEDNIITFAKYKSYNIDCSHWLESGTLSLSRIVDMLIEPLLELESLPF